MKIKLENVRLAFPDLFDPTTFNGEGDPAFSATFLMSPAHPDVEVIKAAIEQVGKDKWGEKWAVIKKTMEATDKTALHDGNVKSSYAGFEGNLYISSRNKTRPLVIDKDKTPLVKPNGRPYGGCFVNASLELWAQDNNFGKRINATLRGVQFLRDGDAFSGGGAASDDEFDSVDDEDKDLDFV